MKYRELIKIPDLFTLSNAILGIFSIFFSINRNFIVAGIMMIAAIFFDYFDGKIARKIRRKGEFGKQLDSLSDVISFGVAPAVFVFQVSGYSLLNLVILGFFVCAGVLRLARYNITEMKGYYSGLPITNAGWAVPVWYFLGLPYINFLVLAIGILFVSPIRIKKVM